jgi:hypothetical protein
MLIADFLIVVIAAHIANQPARLTTAQRKLVGGYILPDGRVDPREAPEAADHLRRLGGPDYRVAVRSASVDRGWISLCKDA